MRADHFKFNTPLNGGDGFEWAGEAILWVDGEERSLCRGTFYRSDSSHVHTLDVRCEGTVILLEQMADEVPVGVPTNAYRALGSKNPPNLSGLYERMTPDKATRRISQFLDLIGNR